ncbi:hypothetical protein [Hydrogenophaga sp. 2FB]|uniref:hypothetical protein n=1 Tax=Hydrogenophaga sp. 2FB TaxID=2502187 RepID=UPI0010F4E87E|nr:hypothetical protein [Hydrogenophaga sp. 2FB]
MTFEDTLDWQDVQGRPSYRYFKLIFTAALRLGAEVKIRTPLHIVLSGDKTSAPQYKDRITYEGKLSINGAIHDGIVYVLDHRKSNPELVTFWRKSQFGDSPGTRGGAHPFVELYMEYLRGTTVERKTFDTKAVADLCEVYNRDPRFSIQSWIVNNVPTDRTEPPEAAPSVEALEPDEDQSSALPALRLLNKWKTDVRATGIPYTNYEIDACVRGVTWSPGDERISLEVHWENGNYVRVRDFGRFDRYAPIAERRSVFEYLKASDGATQRARLILTVKGDSTDWVLAAATMLRRLPDIS